MPPSVVVIHRSSSGSVLWCVKDFSVDCYDELINLPLIEKPEFRAYGRLCRQARDVGFFSIDRKVTGYRYSGQEIRSNSMYDYPFLISILEYVNNYLKTQFNAILVNRYNDGSKYISAHSDDEKELDPSNSVVASLSFGATRKFRIRDRATKEKIDYDHNSGELLMMQGINFQKEFTHEIPKQLKVKQPRISLTFRKHILHSI